MMEGVRGRRKSMMNEYISKEVSRRYALWRMHDMDGWVVDERRWMW